MPINFGTRRALLEKKARSVTGPFIVSAQQVTITIGSLASSATATISAVDTSKSFLVFGGYTTTSSVRNVSACQPRIELTNGTTVTAYRDSTISTTSTTVKCTVLEFNSRFIKSVQRGTISIAGTNSATATISAVDPANSVSIYLGSTCTNTTTSNSFFISYNVLTDATTVTATTAAVSNSTVGFCVVEFQPNIIKSVQQNVFTSTSSATVETSSINTVSLNDSVMFFGGYSTLASAFVNIGYCRLAAPNSISFEREGTATFTRTYSNTVVEFYPGVIKRVQRFLSPQVSSATLDTTISPVSLSASGVINLMQSGPATVDPSQYYMTGELTTSTNFRSTTVTSNTRTGSFSVVEFN